MRSSLTCDRCQGKRFWHLRAVRERGEQLEELPVVAERDPHFDEDAAVEHSFDGHYELLVCFDCGNTAWYARGIRDVSKLQRSLHACGECGHREAYCVVMRERDRDGAPSDMRVVRKGFPKYWSDGWFEALVCGRCSHVDWYVRELTAIDPDPLHGLTAEAGFCERCKYQRLWRVEPITELGRWGARPLGLDYRPTLFGHEAIGTLSTSICRRCGSCEWTARNFAALQHEPKRGVALVDGQVAMRHEGPYR